MTQFNRVHLNVGVHAYDNTTAPEPAGPALTIDGVEVKNLMGFSIAAGACASPDGESPGQTLVTLILMAEVVGDIDVKYLPADPAAA